MRSKKVFSAKKFKSFNVFLLSFFLRNVILHTLRASFFSSSILTRAERVLNYVTKKKRCKTKHHKCASVRLSLYKLQEVLYSVLILVSVFPYIVLLFLMLKATKPFKFLNLILLMWRY